MTQDNSGYLVVTRPDRFTDGRECVIAEHPELGEGCIAYGATEEEAMTRLAAVRGAYLHSLATAGEPVPAPSARAKRIAWTMGTGSYPVQRAERSTPAERSESVTV